MAASTWYLKLVVLDVWIVVGLLCSEVIYLV
jgi:hypothetical protein